MSSLEAMF